VLRDAVFWQQVNGIGCEIARTHIVRQGKEAILRRREGRQQDQLAQQDTGEAHPRASEQRAQQACVANALFC